MRGGVLVFPHLSDVLSLFLKAPQLKTAPTGCFTGLTEEKAQQMLRIAGAILRRKALSYLVCSLIHSRALTKASIHGVTSSCDRDSPLG